jgi:hypothetical protein
MFYVRFALSTNERSMALFVQVGQYSYDDEWSVLREDGIICLTVVHPSGCIFPIAYMHTFGAHGLTLPCRVVAKAVIFCWTLVDQQYIVFLLNSERFQSDSSNKEISARLSSNTVDQKFHVEMGSVSKNYYCNPGTLYTQRSSNVLMVGLFYHNVVIRF